MYVGAFAMLFHRNITTLAHIIWFLFRHFLILCYYQNTTYFKNISLETQKKGKRESRTHYLFLVSDSIPNKLCIAARWIWGPRAVTAKNTPSSNQVVDAKRRSIFNASPMTPTIINRKAKALLMLPNLPQVLIHFFTSSRSLNGIYITSFFQFLTPQ